MREYTLVRGPLSASSVTRPLARQEIGKYMRENTQVRSHLSADIVTRPFVGGVILKSMKKDTVVGFASRCLRLSRRFVNIMMTI